MEESYSESDVSLSPSQILQRLQVLRQLQLMQRGKLQKQQLQYKESSETSSNYTDIVSHFSSSASYNTFCSLLQSSNDISNECTPRIHTSDYSQKVQEKDLIDGISVLNLSQESEFIVTSPLSGRSKVSESSKRPEINHDDEHQGQSKGSAAPTGSNSVKSVVRNQIALDEMPILSPKQNFEAILLERLQKEKSVLSEKSPQNTLLSKNISKKPFLRKGEGTARFGVKKNAIVIQNTQSLPWRRKSFQNKPNDSPLKQTIINKKSEKSNPDNSELIIPDIKIGSLTRKNKHQNLTNGKDETDRQVTTDQHTCSVNPKPTNKQTPIELPSSKTLQNLRPMQAAQKIEFAKSKHPLITNKGKTWASVLTKEQNDFLSQLKQSDYYKNFNSPSKSIISDASCDEMSNVKLQRETAEQNMFELLENKVNHESFNLENSFFNRFLKRSNLECSGESTPLVMQKCLSNNPGLMHLGLKDRKRNEDSQSDAETCCSNYSDCCSDSCSTASCCSCKTVEETSNSIQKSNKNSDKSKKSSIKNTKKVTINQNEDNDDTITDNDIMKANMAEMNAKLVSTSELLKERLCELEDEIETFRKENAGIAKLREEIDQDRQKFYEEKAAFEQKFNEDKVLSEYYLAEEKEKLSKQKQIYDRYVKEMRGRLNKKDKDEVVNLKKEISDLKEEIRIKDAKSTSTIARLRNQIKIMEKEKKDLHDEVEKFKKQNKRIQHSNEVTRRLTNIKYLEEINKKLTNMSSKDSKTEVSVDRDAKYKAYEIERQSRKRTVDQAPKGALRLRAKSVPNLNVTSRYAKYFSQRDTASQDPKEFNIEPLNLSDVEDDDKREHNDTLSNRSLSEDVSEDENYLEKIYAERFKSNSPKSNRSSGSNLNFSYNFVDKHQLNENTKEFFMQKSNPGSSRSSKSPKRTISPNDRGLNRSKSPASSYNNKSQSIHNSATRYSDNSLNRSSSPISVFNHSSLRSNTVIQNDKLLNASPEPAVKRPVNKTSLNPTEYRNSDGSRELRFPNGNVKYISADSKYSKFVYYNGDVKENFYSEGRIKYFYAETKTYHTTHADGLEILEFPDGQVEKRYKDGSSEIRLPNGSIRYFDPKNVHVREEWRFPDGAALTVAASGERRVVFSNKQVEVHAKDHKRREFPDGTVKLLYNDGTSETRYASGRIRIKDKHGNLIMDSAPD